MVRLLERESVYLCSEILSNLICVPKMFWLNKVKKKDSILLHKIQKLFFPPFPPDVQAKSTNVLMSASMPSSHCRNTKLNSCNKFTQFKAGLEDKRWVSLTSVTIFAWKTSVCIMFIRSGAQRDYRKAFCKFKVKGYWPSELPAQWFCVCLIHLKHE